MKKKAFLVTFIVTNIYYSGVLYS